MRQLASGQVSGASGAKRDENLHRLSTVQRIVAVAHQGAKQRLPWRTGRRLSFGLDGENLWFGEDRFAVRAPGESYPAVVHAVVGVEAHPADCLLFAFTQRMVRHCPGGYHPGPDPPHLRNCDHPTPDANLACLRSSSPLKRRGGFLVAQVVIVAEDELALPFQGDDGRAVPHPDAALQPLSHIQQSLAVS